LSVKSQSKECEKKWCVNVNMYWNVERMVDCVCLFLGDYSRK
jgi:hypothetical protein